MLQNITTISPSPGEFPLQELSVMISDDLQWNHLVVTKTKKAAKRLYFPRQLKRAGRGSNNLVQFY